MVTEEEIEEARGEGAEGEGAEGEGARAARRRRGWRAAEGSPSPEGSGLATPLLPDQLLHLGADRLDVRLQDVAAPVAAIALERDERRLDDQVWTSASAARRRAR